jgi:hypothetical protein
MKSLQDRFYAPIEKAARKIVEYEAKNVTKAVNKHLKERSEAGFNNWLDDFYTAMPKHIENHLKPVMTAYAEASQKLAAGVIGAPVGMTKELTEFADDYISTYTLRHTGSSVGQLKALVASTEAKKLAAVLKKRVKEWEKTRPAKIARDEVIRESNAVVRASYASAGVKKLKWITQGSKSCDFCNSLSGKIVGIEKNFIEEGTELEGKTGSGQYMSIFGPKAHPPIHIACVCAIIPIFSAGQIAKGFVKAKTIKEAEEWAVKRGITKETQYHVESYNSNLEKIVTPVLSLDKINDIHEALDKALYQSGFGKMAKPLDLVKFEDIDNANATMGGAGSITFGPGAIMQGTPWLKNRLKYFSKDMSPQQKMQIEKTIKARVSGKYNYYPEHSAYAFKPEKAWESVTRHETGHIFHHRYLDEIDEFWQDKCAGKNWRKYAPTSRAEDSWHETMAENYTLYTANKKENLHSDIIEFFDHLKGAN